MLSDLRASPDGHHYLPRQVRLLSVQSEGHGAGETCPTLAGGRGSSERSVRAAGAAEVRAEFQMSGFTLIFVALHFKHRKNRPRNGGICVANHTSPIDVIILASDGYYAMVRPLSLAFLGWAFLH